MNQNILIVASESVQIQGLVRGLRGASFSTHLLPDARSTLGLLRNWMPAAVIIDKALPDLSGFDLCRIIKSESRTLSIFVFLLLDDVNDQLNAFEVGAADCVMKPFNIPKLVLQIGNLLRSTGDSVVSHAKIAA